MPSTKNNFIFFREFAFDHHLVGCHRRNRVDGGRHPDHDFV
jgi:hypothetical protein